MTREEKAQFCMDNPRHSPAFQFYPDNWWGSRHIAAMSIEQRGIHSSLIFSAWLENNCGIPENEVCLSARIPDSLKDSAFKVLEWCWFFYNGFWFCERLLNERIKQINLSKIRILSGSEGGRPLKSKINKSKPIDNQLDSKQKPNHNQTITNSEEEDVIENENENTNVIKDEKFLEFWKVYPKKVGKGDAEKAWNKIKEPSKILELIIKALEWQTKSDQWKKENGQYIPNPSTYLNRRHWEDEKGEVLNGTGKSGLSGNCRENNFRNNEPALGARAKPGEYDEGIITLEGVPDHR